MACKRSGVRFPLAPPTPFSIVVFQYLTDIQRFYFCVCYDFVLRFMIMAKRKDMKNLVARNGWYHFRGYVPKDLIAIGHPKERTFSLNTHDYTVAIQRRDEQRIAHTKWIAEQRARRDGHYTVLKDLTDAQILGFARAAYALMMPYVEANREAQAARSPDERNAAIRAREQRLRIMETGAVEGSEITGVFEYYTDKVLAQRMVRIDSADTYSRLVARVGEAVIQNMREQIAAISGKPGTEINPLFIDVDTGAPRMNKGLPDGRPNAPVRGDLTLQSQVDAYIDYLSNRQQSKNVQGSAAALNILVKLLGRQADVRTLQRKDFEDYKSIIMKLPPNAKKKYPKLSILKICRNSQRYGWPPKARDNQRVFEPCNCIPELAG